jgi:lysozyme
LKKYIIAIIPAALVFAAVGYITGCEKTYRSEDKLTAGIFLEPEERAALPPDQDLTPIDIRVGEKGS